MAVSREGSTENVDPRSPLTVFARHRVRAGDEGAFESWIEGITAACKQFEGYIGTEVIRPMSASSDYLSIFRFDDYEHLCRWMDSDDRKRWLEKTDTFSDHEPEVAYHSLEYWFTQEPNKAAPPRYKMALVTLAVIWPLVHFVPSAIRAGLPGPDLLVEGVSVATIVVLMTYLVMPGVNRVLRPWLASG